MLAAFGLRGNIVILERPARILTLVVTVRAALRARQRQYAMRDLHGRLQQAIREKEESAAILDAIFLNAPVGLSQFDTALRYQRVNPQLARINGVPMEAHIGKTIPELLPRMPLSVVDDLRQVLTTGQPLVDVEVHGETRASPEKRWFNVHYFPVRLPSAEIIGVGRVVQDITEKKRAAADEARRRADAERAATELREVALLRETLIGTLGHDLRNPLSAILMSAQLLQQDAGLSDRALRAVQRIATSGNRMQRMVHDLLDFARSRLAGGIPVERTPLDLHELAREVVQEMSIGAPGSDIRLDLTGDGLGSWDGDRMAEVLSNLLRNALQHGAEAPIDVRIEDAGDGIRLEVSNLNRQGPIPARALATLFEPFRQGQRTGSGLGLGLYIVDQVVRAHGGEISVQSDTERTTFAVQLPRQDGGGDAWTQRRPRAADDLSAQHA
jgi:PAS domain S-box-containing protein